MLLEFLPCFEAPDFRSGRWITPPGTVGYYEYSRAAASFIDAVYASGLVEPFDWPAWTERAHQLMSQPEALARARLATIRRLITFHVRKERFCEGHIANVLETGHMVAVLRRARELTAGHR